MKTILFSLIILFGFQAPVAAESYTSTEDYSDVLFYIEEEITNFGLVISSRNHISSMLTRTSEAVGADKKIYENADILSFCSAQLSYDAMAADPMNIQFCPYNIYLFKLVGSDEVVVGFRQLPNTPELDAVEELLRSIIQAAL